VVGPDGALYQTEDEQQLVVTKRKNGITTVVTRRWQLRGEGATAAWPRWPAGRRRMASRSIRGGAMYIADAIHIADPSHFTPMVSFTGHRRPQADVRRRKAPHSTLPLDMGASGGRHDGQRTDRGRRTPCG
jgi:hypothetical protein